jgi:hypothetical protein
MWNEEEISIGKIKDLIEQGYEIEVDSPDGWVEVSDFVNKGLYEEFVLTLEDGNMTPIRCNAQHLFETSLGWKSARELLSIGKFKVLTREGYKNANIYLTGNKIPIVDIQVEHENHRYYTENVSSHNTGVGKSLFMCHCAAANLSMGMDVLYITAEMAEEKIAERIDANLLDVPIERMQNVSEGLFKDRIHSLKNKTTGKLIIKEYPTSQANVGHFRSLLNELKLKKGFVPTIIYIDYLNICASFRLKSMGGSINSYSYIKAIAEEVRGLAVEFDVPIVSATQTTRSGYGSSDPGLEDTSESFGLPATADLMFALVSSEELEEDGQIMVKQLKNRYNDVNRPKRFIIGINRNHMRLFDAEDLTGKELIDDSPQINNNDGRKILGLGDAASEIRF